MRLGLTQLGNIDIAVRAIARKLGIDLVRTPPSTERTLSLGVKHSPEMACLPFKIQLGNMIEALEQGADTLLMPGGAGPCRFGYYHTIHERILRELGYKFQMVTQDRGIMHIVKYLTDGAPIGKVVLALRFGIAKLKALDNLERLVHKMRPIVRDKGEAARTYGVAIKAIDSAGDYRALNRTKRQYQQKLMGLATVTSTPLIVGLTGEIFVVADPFTNMGVEAELGNLGVWVRRSIFISDFVTLHMFGGLVALREKNKAHRAAMPYVTRHLGGDGWQSVGEKVLHATDWDGVVHLEPLGCMPEITARNIMPSTKEKLPVLNLIYDEHTGRAGMINRIEAFADMLRRKKQR